MHVVKELILDDFSMSIKPTPCLAVNVNTPLDLIGFESSFLKRFAFPGKVSDFSMQFPFPDKNAISHNLSRFPRILLSFPQIERRFNENAAISAKTRDFPRMIRSAPEMRMLRK